MGVNGRKAQIRAHRDQIPGSGSNHKTSRACYYKEPGGHPASSKASRSPLSRLATILVCLLSGHFSGRAPEISKDYTDWTTLQRSARRFVEVKHTNVARVAQNQQGHRRLTYGMSHNTLYSPYAAAECIFRQRRSVRSSSMERRSSQRAQERWNMAKDAHMRMLECSRPHYPGEIYRSSPIGALDGSRQSAYGHAVESSGVLHRRSMDPFTFPSMMASLVPDQDDELSLIATGTLLLLLLLLGMVLRPVCRRRRAKRRAARRRRVQAVWVDGTLMQEIDFDAEDNDLEPISGHTFRRSFRMPRLEADLEAGPDLESGDRHPALFMVRIA